MVYADSSFANNEDSTVQLRYLVSLCDAQNSADVLHFTGHKSRRVVRSVLGGKVVAFADYLDYGLTIK